MRRCSSMLPTDTTLSASAVDAAPIATLFVPVTFAAKPRAVDDVPVTMLLTPMVVAEFAWT